MRIVGLIGILALAAPALVISQGRPTLAFRGDAGFVWVRSDTAPAGAGAIRLRGPVLGGEGRLVFKGFSVGLGLSSGTLEAADQGTAKRDLIEGRLLVAARPLPWLEMSVGPFVRAYVTDAVTERWVFWQARARADAPIVTSGLTSYVELWRAVSSQVNLVAGAGQNPESIVATKVVAKRHDYAVAIVINIRTCVTSIQNRVSDLKVVKVYNAAREKHRRVIADGAISDNQRPGIEHRAANL